MDPQIAVQLTEMEIRILIEALDAYEYWQLGDTLPRNNGIVFIPGDLPPDEDRYWGADPKIAADDAENIEGIRRCRALAERLGSRLC